ncbi:hypothetical protein SAMD00023353_1001270 [Rosellinia necatrix]|uniref:Rhodopsin domain-containing protein n=1 Tax=Rosellinia necatrix TaxID=77044 RepID=A0A1W2TBS8_ROSNE|nr:hypothetical protein SAMD00023353_1001270 [Rosellinia necatrix]
MATLDFSSLSPQDLQEKLDGPALRPPDGVTPNFSHPKNGNTVALAGVLVPLILTTMFLLMRVYVVFFKMKQSRLGDYFMLVAYVFYMVVCIGSLVRLFQAGLFVHQWDIRGGDIKHYLQIVLVGIEFWMGGILLVKASILVEWLRLFAPARGRTAFSTCCKVLLAVNILTYSSIIITVNLSCRPFGKFFDKTLKGSCIDLRKIHLAAVVVDLMLDIGILLLPQRIIWGLQMTKSKKIGVSMVFTIGVLSTIASAFLLDSIVKWNKSDDMTYHYSAVVLWAIAEMTGGILVFCAPMLPKVFRELGLPRCLSGCVATASSIMSRVKWSRPAPDGRQPRSKMTSKSRDYEEIDESGSVRLQALGSPRPTDRQYGIAVTTDIVVTETYVPGHQPTVRGPDRGSVWDGGARRMNRM